LLHGVRVVLTGLLLVLESLDVFIIIEGLLLVLSALLTKALSLAMPRTTIALGIKVVADDGLPGPHEDTVAVVDEHLLLRCDGLILIRATAREEDG